MTRKIIKSAETRRKFGGISNTTMHRYIADGTIPPPFKIGSGKVNAWFEHVIDARLAELSQSEEA